MNMYVIRLTFRSIRSFRGRYLALLLIVALSVGFFAGLKVTKDAMAHTCDDYLSKQEFCDFRLLSTIGFCDDEVRAFEQLPQVKAAEGCKMTDAMLDYEGSEYALKLLSLTEKVNLASLTAGRMPETEQECLADARMFERDDIGSVIRLADASAEDGELLNVSEWEIVGLAQSPLYLSDDRGTTQIGTGTLDGFLYLPTDSFSGSEYAEIALKLMQNAPVYSDEYVSMIDETKDEITGYTERLTEARYEKLLIDNGIITEFMAQAAGTFEPETYVLTRAENAGYVSFENDTSIVSGIANMFPVFFILIAMLVCITTMTRMVDEERTQTGVLKAMGYQNGAITAKYLLYAGSATTIGWGAGFFVGTWGLPQVFWLAYRTLYDFAPLAYLFSPSLAALTFAASMAGILGSTYLSCRKELVGCPAILIRPRAAKTGKRIFLEWITPFWKRLAFLQKVTLRNMFRYKRRLFMMLVGIGCCSGLVVTAFGVRDSMIDTALLQFDGVQLYDLEAAFSVGERETLCKELDTLEGVEDYLFCSLLRADLHGTETMNGISLFSFADTDRLPQYWNFHTADQAVPLPEDGEVIISCRIAEKLSLEVGDELELQSEDRKTLTAVVSGIFDNYVNNFAVVSPKTQEDAFDGREENTVLLAADGDTQELAALLADRKEVRGVTQLSAVRETVDHALSCLDYIIWLIVLFSGALAFIVIFNLTNINLAERSREIATVQVLGFYPRETESYVLRENLVLSVIAGLIGLPLGTVFHGLVMQMIVVDNMSFDIHIALSSYLLALACTVLFAAVVDLFMKRQIQKIHMAEALKAVE